MTTLLVVDEEANTRLLYKDEFQDEGYEVTVAETTEEAGHGENPPKQTGYHYIGP